ncbi:hypothetical protein M885DRAFT_156129 [Pelagophyceae sp. CCMP2097]|nr:hypothetical protein M885DRAFT_156129 [Pelagophyceae sp. CCMP2097]
MDRAIWDAFKNGDFAPIESLLAHGAAPAYVRNAGGGETALMAAAFHGKEALCRALLALGADAAATDRHGNTAAHLARARAFAAVAALLDAGAPAPGGTAPPRSAPASPSYDAGAPPPPAGGAESPQSPIRPRRKGDESHPRHLLSSRHRAEDDDLAALAAAAVDEGVLYTDDVSELECSPDEESSPDEAGASNAQRLADGRPGPAAAPRAPSPPAAAARAPPAAAARPAARPAAAPRASEPALRSVHVEGFAEPAAWSDAPLAPSADSRGPHGTDAPAAAADKEAGDGTSAMDEGAGDGTSAMDDDDPRPPPSAATADASAPAGTSDDDGAPEGPADAAAMDEDDEDSPLTAAAAPTPGPTAISADSGTKAAATEAAPLTAAAPSTEG